MIALRRRFGAAGVGKNLSHKLPEQQPDEAPLRAVVDLERPRRDRDSRVASWGSNFPTGLEAKPMPEGQAKKRWAV